MSETFNEVQNQVILNPRDIDQVTVVEQNNSVEISVGGPQGPAGPTGSPFYNGSFEDTTTQVASGGTATSVSGSINTSTLTVTNSGFSIAIGQTVTGNANIPAGALVTNTTASSGTGITVTIDKTLTGNITSATGVVFMSSNLVTVNTTTNSSGVSVVNGSKITYANAGSYYLNFTGQFRFSGGASSYDVIVWYAKNGVAVANTSSTFTLTSAQGSQVLANITDIVSLAAGDYIQFYWYTLVVPSAGPNGIYLYPVPAIANRPLSASVNINTFNVG